MEPVLRLVKIPRSIEEPTFRFLLQFSPPEKQERIFHQRVKQNADAMVVGAALARHLLFQVFHIPLSKLNTRVRFPSPAPQKTAWLSHFWTFPSGFLFSQNALKQAKMGPFFEMDRSRYRSKMTIKKFLTRACARKYLLSWIPPSMADRIKSRFFLTGGG